jgi:hypothetical protein
VVAGRQACGGGTSRISREAYVRICEGLGVQVPGATRRQHGDAGQVEQLEKPSSPQREIDGAR